MTNITFFWCICLININSFWNINHIIIQHLWFIHSSKKTSGWYLLPSWKTDIRLIVKLWVILNYATSHNHPQRAKTSHSKPQWATANHDNLQQAITSHEPQLPQLKRKMNKTHKKLHSLVNALSPLNHLAAAILMKIVLLLVLKCAAHAVAFWFLVLIQCLGIILFVVEAFGSVFLHVILRTWQLKGEK